MKDRQKYHSMLKLKAAKIKDLKDLVKHSAGQDSMNRYWNRILAQSSEECSEDYDNVYDDGDTAGLCDIYDYV